MGFFQIYPRTNLKYNNSRYLCIILFPFINVRKGPEFITLLHHIPSINIFLYNMGHNIIFYFFSLG